MVVIAGNPYTFGGHGGSRIYGGQSWIIRTHADTCGGHKRGCIYGGLRG